MAGSVRKDGSTWCFVVDLGKDPNGKRIQKRKRGFKTKKEAQIALAEVVHELSKGTFANPKKMKFRDFLEQWLDDKQTKVKKGTLETYTWLTRTHIIPALGEVDIANLTPIMLQQHYNNLTKNSVLSDENIRKVHILIKDALRKAERWGLINRNVAALVDSPKVSKKEIRVWDSDEVLKFLEVAKDSPYYMIFLLAVTTGMRKGEILGLQWKHINIPDGYLSVAQVYSKHEKKLVPGAKTKSGVRTVDLPDETVQALTKHKEQIEILKRNAEDLFQDQDLVNCTPLGTPIDPSNVTRTFRQLIKKADLPVIRFHDLRHTHATLLLKQGVHPKIVAERLGHADTRMTLDTYSHLLPSMQKETAKNFGKMLFGTK
ncbi:site-specific integrase [Brevibacillus agri]|uniref:site-specific integrase n=1 Tax=Brevibacillus agri TaxID=51101 RepID=UPI0018CE6B24|nr:site-specific integrase [Brevibacillus agri]MBG9568203.1 integrase [Brevibacillus agri]